MHVQTPSFKEEDAVGLVSITKNRKKSWSPLSQGWREQQEEKG